MGKKLILTLCILSFLLIGGIVTAEETTIQTEGTPMTSEEILKEQKVKQKTGEIKGTVTAIDATNKTISLQGAKGSANVFWDDKTIVRFGDKKSIADLKAGDHIKVKYLQVQGKKLATSIILKKRRGPKASS